MGLTCCDPPFGKVGENSDGRIAIVDAADSHEQSRSDVKRLPIKERPALAVREILNDDDGRILLHHAARRARGGVPGNVKRPRNGRVSSHKTRRVAMVRVGGLRELRGDRITLR